MVVQVASFDLVHEALLETMKLAVACRDLYGPKVDVLYSGATDARIIQLQLAAVAFMVGPP